jgi:hypothetical protein
MTERATLDRILAAPAKAPGPSFERVLAALPSGALAMDPWEAGLLRKALLARPKVLADVLGTLTEFCPRRPKEQAVAAELLELAFEMKPPPPKSAARRRWLILLNHALIMSFGSGQYARSAAWADRARPYARENPYICHSAACSYARVKRNADAVAMCRIAVETNYEQLRRLRADRDLGAVRARADYKALFEAKRAKPSSSKVALPELRGVALVRECIRNLPRRGARRVAAPANRRGFSKTEPFSPTLAEFLAFDATFQTISGKQLQPWTWKAKAGEPAPADLEALLRAWWKDLGYPIGPRTTLRAPVTGRKVRRAADLLTPRLAGRFYALPHKGEQLALLYVGTPAPNGEYPVLGVDWEGSYDEREDTLQGEAGLFLKWPAFDLYLAEMTGVLDMGTQSLRKVPGLAREVRALMATNPGVRP